MKYPIRFLLVWLRARLHPKRDIGGISRIALRVALTDLDVMRHMNNGTYLTVQDLGRMDWLLRTGLAQRFTAKDWGFVVAAQTITYRASLHLGERYHLETRLIGYDAKSVYMEQRFVVDGQIRARGIVRGRAIKLTGGTVSMDELVDVVPEMRDLDATLPQWIVDWAAATALPPTRAQAPSVWEREAHPHD